MRSITAMRNASIAGLLLLSLASFGCGGSSSSTASTVAPAIITQPVGQTVLEGATATFSVVASGTAPLSYQWNKGGIPIIGATSASYPTPATTLADSGSSFTVTVSNAAGHLTSSPATLTVHTNPAIASFSANPVSITSGNNATLSFSFTGGAGSIDNGVGAVNSGTDVTVKPAATTTYTLTVDNGFGATKTKTATVTVNAVTVPTTTPIQVSLGDAPSDWIMAFGMTVNSITLTSSNGTIMNVVSAPAPMEMMQSMATMQPISAMAVPQGTYTQAMVTFSAVTMGYMDPVTHTYMQKNLAGPFTATVPFSPNMTIGTSPMALNFDMNMGSSVTIDGAGNVILTPVMTVAMGSASGTGTNPWQGTMHHQVGTVSSVSGAQFTMGSMMGIQQMAFRTDASTQFVGTSFTGMGSMTTGMMVAVDAALQPDGSYLAQRVESMGAGASGMMGGGLVTTIAGNPPTQITLAANAGQGGGMMASSMAGTLTVTIPAATPYTIDSDDVDLTGLPFAPTFDATSLAKGQRVEVVSGGGLMGGGMSGGQGSLTASQMRLEQQGLHGTVSSYLTSGSQATFTLTLPTDSAFTSLTGATTIKVYQQAGTQLHGLSTIANGNDVMARGLLFYDTSASAYKLVANWITPGLATPAPPIAGSTMVQAGLGDAPSDWITAFGMTVNTITLTDSNGNTLNMVPTSSPMEMMQLMATIQPVSSVAIPQGTYTQAMVTFSAVTMGYMDPSSGAYKQQTLPGPFTAMVPFSPAMTVGTAPMALSFDMNMGASVAMDASGKVTLTPVMTASMGSTAGTGTNPWQGAMQHRIGSVASASGAQFTMGSMMGMQQTTFMTNASTQFAGSGFTSMSSMTSGMMVSVDATMQADGTYLAQRVEYMGVGTNGMMGGGVVTAITGNPPTQITLATNSGQGGGMMASAIARTLTVTIPAATPYSIDADGVDLTGLAFAPTFDAATLTKGQRVDVVSGSGMMGGGMSGGASTLTASQVRLEQQGLHGTVSGYTANGAKATFTLTLPSDSAFTTLTGATTIQVIQQAGTQLHGLTVVADTNDVVVRGLLFKDAGTYRLVASWIVAP